jgi:hypothetical protein
MIEIINKGTKDEKGKEDKEDTQVQYTFINLYFMLKKMRIDLIYSKELNNNFKYLEFYSNKKFEQCSHLFLAKTIADSEEVD